jgi:hypothetical protein
MKTHLQRDLDRRGAIRGIEGVAEIVPGQRGQLFRQLDHRLVGKAGQHRVFQRVQLRLQGGVDARVRVAEQVHPPRADAIQVAPAFMVVQPRALAAATAISGTSSWCCICVHGCQTLRRLRAIQSEEVLCVKIDPDYLVHSSHEGLRFSRKEATPSRPSSDARMAAMRPTVSSSRASVTGWPAISRTSRLASRTAFGLFFDSASMPAPPWHRAHRRDDFVHEADAVRFVRGRSVPP